MISSISCLGLPRCSRWSGSVCSNVGVGRGTEVFCIVNFSCDVRKKKTVQDICLVSIINSKEKFLSVVESFTFYCFKNPYTWVHHYYFGRVV